MGKNRTLKSKVKESIETDSEVEEKVISSKRVLRSRVQSIESLKKNDTHCDQYKIDAYDADSEPENKYEEISDKKPELTVKPLVSKSHISPVKTIKEIRNLKDFTVNLDDCCQQESPVKIQSPGLAKTPVKTSQRLFTPLM